MKFEESNWGELNGIQVKLITITNPNNSFRVQLTNLGASVVSVEMLDKSGQLGHIHLGYTSPEDFHVQKGCNGSIVGRVASIITFGCFSLGDEKFHPTKNNAGVHTQHGGKEGFHFKLWQIKTINSTPDESQIQIIMQYVSADGEEGFPGELVSEVEYRISDHKLGWDIRATTSKKTIANLTNHGYWNLENPDVLIDNQELQINANQYLEVPVGKIVRKTLGAILHLPIKKEIPMPIKPLSMINLDLNQPRLLHSIFTDFGDLDTNFILNQVEPYSSNLFADLSSDQLYYAASLKSHESGRIMKIYTTEPAMVVYSGNSMKGMKCLDKPQKKHSAICLETMKPSNSIKLPEFREKVILKPNETYHSQTVHHFLVQK